ncbi:2-dehydro-3-deoxygluconokinase [compost metagenome]
MPPRFDIVALGEAMVEFNQTGRDGGRSYLQGFGGDTSNAMIAAARQGARCAYVTRLGNDDFGRMFLDLWRRESVDTSGVALDSSAHTGVYFVRHGNDGHAFSYLRAGSAASRMRPSDLPLGMLRSTRYLHVSGISQAISASATDAVSTAIQVAAQAGAKVAYDPNLRLKLWPLERAREVILATIPHCAHFLPSLDDVRLLSGREAPADIVAWCHHMGARQVVLKLGSQGCVVSDGTQLSFVPPFPVTAVDATGAGDCFDGAFLAQLAAGNDPVSAARWAGVAAALTTKGYGAVEPLPTREAVRDALGAWEAG